MNQSIVHTWAAANVHISPTTLWSELFIYSRKRQLFWTQYQSHLRAYLTILPVAPPGILKGRDQWLQPTVSMGCNYLSLPFIRDCDTSPLIYASMNKSNRSYCEIPWSLEAAKLVSVWYLTSVLRRLSLNSRAIGQFGYWNCCWATAVHTLST